MKCDVCGKLEAIPETRICPRCATECDQPYDAVTEAAERVATEVLHHIDTMYPGMWDGVPKTARISLRHFIQSEIKTRLAALSG